MKFELNFEECLKDSPRFRSSLASCETNIDHLELRLERVVRLCANMIDAGKHYSQSNGNFIAGLVDLADHFGSEEDFLIKSNLAQFADLLREVQSYFNILLEQAHRSICKNLHELVKEDIRKVREARKSFEKMSGDLDQALTRNAAASKIKGAECEESANYLTAVRGCFSHTAMDYVYQIGLLQGRQRFVVLDTILSFIHAESTFFHQGTDSFQDADFLKTAAANLEVFASDMTTRQKLMEERHDLVQKRESTLKADSNLNRPDSAVFNGIVPTIVSETEEASLAAIEGYLFKRTTNAFRTWNRRWFMLKNNQLIYCKREGGGQEAPPPLARNASTMSKNLTSGTQSASSSPYPRHRDGANNMSASFVGALPVSASTSSSALHVPSNFTIMEPDLRLCSVKPLAEGVDRRFCLEVVSPSARHVLQADSDVECLRWISAIQHGISQAYRCAAENSSSNNNSQNSNSLSNSAYGNNSLNALVNAGGRSSVRNSPLVPKKNVGGGGGGGKTGAPDANANDDGGVEGDAPTSSALASLIAIPGNDKCCDCGLADPRWASINLGITLCIECSGIHRSLGVHLSKVRSMTLDAWEPESVKVMSELGNDVVNSIYLSSHSGSSSISPTSPRQEKEAWIKAKYVDRIHLAPLPFLPHSSQQTQQQQLNQLPNQHQQQQPAKLPKTVPANVTRWLVAPMPKKRDSKLTAIIANHNNNNNPITNGRKLSSPSVLSHIASSSSSSPSPHSSPSAKASAKPPSPVRPIEAMEAASSDVVVVEAPAAFKDAPATAIAAVALAIPASTAEISSAVSASAAPSSDSAGDAAAASAAASTLAAPTSPSSSVDSRLPSPMDISETPTECEDDRRVCVAAGVTPTGSEDERRVSSAVGSAPTEIDSDRRTSAAAGSTPASLSDGGVVGASSTSGVGTDTADTTNAVTALRLESASPSSSSKEQLEKTKGSQRDESKPAVAADHKRLSLRRLSPAQETREQVLVFDGVGLWKTKYLGLDEKLEADANSASPETESLGASSSSPSLSSTASGDPLREDVLDELTALSPNLLLFRAARQRNLRVMCLAFAHRATVNSAPFPADGRSPLMEAVASGSIAACEYLLLNGAKLDAVDVAGRRTALHHATILGHTGQVCQFLKRGANQGALDINGLDAISIAVNAANADIVTLLRLAKLNEEIKESELGNPGDATFSEVFKDFSNMAVEDPDQLNNRYQLLSQDEDGL